jgi:hypothetical protein
MKFCIPVFTCGLFLCACNNPSQNNSATQNNNQSKTQSDSNTPVKASGNNKIRNNIQLDTKDVKVSQAFLLFQNGSLVPETNETNVGKPVKLRLIIDKGWKETNGKVSIGASEKIETHDGQLVLDEKDLFSNIKELNGADAHFITLTATISRLEKLYDYFLVSFRVWDKNGSGEITGSYKLYIK